MQEMKSAKLNEMKSQLNTLVNKGTINQTQADKVIEYMNQSMGKSKIENGNIDVAEKNKIKSMTKEERKAYFEKMRGEKGNFLKELVDNGTLTQEQADAVRNSISHQQGKGLKGK
jgi:polyhydroxyalkanoate synthesis regulator phasin